VDLKDRNHRAFNYKRCFVGKDFVKWLKNNKYATDEIASENLATKLVEQGLIHAVQGDGTGFENSSKLFRFEQPDDSMKEPIDSWCALMNLPELKHKAMDGAELQKAIDGHSDLTAKFGQPSKEGGLNAPHMAEMLFDENNCDLYDAVRPVKWKDPAVQADEANKQEPYDILVIGGGAGGLVTAAQSKGLGAKVCLIER